MNLYIEENKHNPTVEKPKKICDPNHFIIKFKTEEIRKKYAILINKLIQKHEIYNFHIEEKEAYIESKIIYNGHTLTKKEDINFEGLDKIFTKVLEKL